MWKNRVLGYICICLAVLCTALTVGTYIVPSPCVRKENRWAELYDADILPLPAHGENSVNINTADAETLMTLPGIGEQRAGEIIAYREANGAFLHPAGIMEISGIGEKTYAALKDKIKVQE